jgi:hypothetical protein
MRAKGKRLPLRNALLLADPQSPFGTVGGRRWLVAKDVKEGSETQCLGEGVGVFDRLGTSYRCPELLKGPIRVTLHPGDEHREELALHAGVGTRPIRELHVLIEHLEAPPKVRKRQLELPLAVQRHAERHVRPDETARIAKPFGYTHRLLGKMLGLPHLE